MCAIDLRKVIRSHVETGADITVVAKKSSEDRQQHFVVRTDKDGKVCDMAVDYQAKADDYIGMSIFVISRQLLIDVIKECVPHGKYHLERDFIMEQFNAGKLNVNLYAFNGVAMLNQTIEDYMKNSMALLDPKVRQGLFHGDVPIYTKVRDQVPSHYGPNSNIADCILADGSRLYGTADHCILSRGIYLAETADVRDSIIMQGCVIEEGVSIQHAILDKNVHVKAGTKLLGSPKQPLIIRKGAEV